MYMRLMFLQDNLCGTVSNAEDEGQADISERSILPNSF